MVAVLLVMLAFVASWWRTVPVQGDLADLHLVPLRFDPAAHGQWRVTGLWDVQSADIRFGGYSALLLGDNGRFLAFSDRGRRLSFGAPGLAATAGAQADQLPDRGVEQDLFDIESAARDPQTGTYWLGYEGVHAVHRYRADNRADGHVLLPDNWPQNSGAESLVRLADGQFVLLPEDAAQLCRFAGDPVAGADMACTPVTWPEAGYSATDAVQLADGRLLVLMRRLVLGMPPTFDSLLVAGPLPAPDEEWQPQVLLHLEDLLPRENYEGMALRPLANGSQELWLIADDNFSMFQRTLLARLVLAPADSSVDSSAESEADSESAHEKAREGRAIAR